MNDPVAFINGFYQSIMERNARDICACYKISDETYVILEGPRLATRGFDLIKEGWESFCLSDIRLEAIDWNDGPFVWNYPGCTILAGIITLQVRIGKRSFNNIFRASFTLEENKERFCIVHEHVSGALSDPYGIGDWKR